MKDATRKRGRNADAPSGGSKRAGEIEGESCGECTAIHHRQRRASSLACSRGNFANPRDTKWNVVTSGPLSCGGGSRFTLGAGAGTENHDCRTESPHLRVGSRWVCRPWAMREHREAALEALWQTRFVIDEICNSNWIGRVEEADLSEQLRQTALCNIAPQSAALLPIDEQRAVHSTVSSNPGWATATLFAGGIR
ncbi:hypothetical protein DBV15_05705 [Temnothorax longispinosus]|uniref:Uncharacterized protein n=1 Tax=Temnothorax longispinosus TaxID=300112 RepID=A0A4S2JAJ6_9HYME|nr:hypothetical protein DBV15_05705 [Temnothorax longispinosus]